MNPTSTVPRCDGSDWPICHLIGAEVEEVYATGGVRVDPAIGAAGDIDAALVFLRLENGVPGTIDHSRRAVYGYDQRAEVLGSGGCVQLGNLFPNTVMLINAERVGRDLPHHFFVEWYAESYRAEMEAFVDAALKDGPILVTGHDGRMSARLSMAVKRSLDEHRPARVDEILAPPTVSSF